MIKKHGAYYWHAIWIEGRRGPRSLKTDEHGLALERTRDIKNELLAAAHKKKVSLHEFSLTHLECARDTKPASADQGSKKKKAAVEKLG